MKLKEAQVFDYKCIMDSTLVAFENTTCLVGKNESGKTAFLQALSKLSPYKDSGEFNPSQEFPKSKNVKEPKSKTNDENLKKKVITAKFVLDDEEFENIESEHGKDVLKSKEFTVTKYYESTKRYLTIDIDESKAVRHFIEENKDAFNDEYEEIEQLKTLDELKLKLREHEHLEEILDTLENTYPETVKKEIINDVTIPKFFYFDDYSIMPGTVAIGSIEQSDDALEEGEKTFKKFLEVADVSIEDLKSNKNYEHLKGTLESMSNTITKAVFEYWSQNKGLSVKIEKSPPCETDKIKDKGDLIRVRIENKKHGVTVDFDNRSKGFVWFFSFFVYFSQIKNSKEPIILLLDEPGLSLHATAQGDFLRFIDNELSKQHQVIYTTHSPFMIPTQKWETIRTVEDIVDEGTKISSDALKNNCDTVFPLQAALGYEVAQSLFIGKNCLLVEGPSDIRYLQLINTLLGEEENLDEQQWAITPVGGADKILQFIALLGLSVKKMNIAVLLDFSKDREQRIKNIIKEGFLKGENLILLSEYNNNKETDIEDLLGEEIYLQLVNECYKEKLNTPLKIEDLSKGQRIVKRIEKYFSSNKLGRFNHYKPCLHMQKNFDNYKEKLREKLEPFRNIFSKLNKLIS